MQRKQFNSDPFKINLELIKKFLNDKDVDNNIILLLRAYAYENNSNFEYLAREFANILSVGINVGIERENEAWHAIENVISTLNCENETTYFISTWQSFSILFPNFKNFNKHCISVQEAYLRFEKYFSKMKDQIHVDSWFTTTTNYEWWLKVDEFYKSRHKE